MAVRIQTDNEAIAVAFLLTVPEVQAIAGDRIGTQLDLTRGAKLPAVRITRVSATSPIRRHLRASNTQLEAWADDELTAQDLAEVCFAALLDDIPGSGPVGAFPGLGIVTGVDAAIEPRSQPDPDTDTPRWLSSVVIYAHPELGGPQ